MEENNKPNEQKIEIIKGNPKDLDISDVKDNLAFEVEKEKKKKENIIIPENQKNSNDN